MKFHVVALVLAVGGTALAEERVVKESEVPAPVLAKVRKKYPGAKLTGFEREEESGKIVYEVKLTDGAKRLEVVCAADGRIVAEEEQITMEGVPEKVIAAYKASAKYHDWTFRKAERVVFDAKLDAPIYELKLMKGSTRAELTFTADGKLSKTEETESHQKK